MRQLENHELQEISGGITASLLQYTSKLITIIFDIGKALGSSINRIHSDKICPL